MKRIVWLASYPKAGNTWFRAILANLDRGRKQPASVNLLGGTIASSRETFDRMTGVEAADLTPAEIDDLRPRVFECCTASEKAADPRFYKIHDAFRSPAVGRPMIPIEATRGVLYFVRDPLDVCISYAFHSSWDTDTAIERMADNLHALSQQTDRLQNQLRQHLSSWSEHVRSWLDNGQVPLHVVRYEDLQADPVETTAAALSFVGLERRREEIERAVDWSSLGRLQAQEREHGFAEKPSRMPQFFRRGMIGEWRNTLTPDQAARIVRDHGEIMRRLGYLAEASP